MGTCRTIVVDRARAVPPLAALLVILGLVACAREEDDASVVERTSGDVVVGADAPAPPASDSAAPQDDDVPLRQLEARVATGSGRAPDEESWVCIGEVSRIEYRFGVDADGVRLGAELDGAGAPTDVTFGWAAIGAETLLLDYVDVGRQVELGSILFADDDAFRTNDGINGPLECRRQRYVDGAPTREAAVVVAGDVNRDVEAAAALAGRIETHSVGDAAFAHWHCDVSEGVATGYVFAGPGVLDAEPRAVAFDDPLEADGDDDGPAAPVVPVDATRLAAGRPFRWLATDGTTLVLVPLDADLAGDGPETLALEAIVFPVGDAFTARRTDGASLQCLRADDA